jgi:hypothetical protein
MKQVFEIIPGSNAPLWLGLGVATMMLVFAAMFLYIAWGARGHVRFEVTGEALQISGDMFGRSLPIASLDIDGMQTLDISHRSPYSPRWRRMGTGLPGYSAGWFSLRNGEKALLFVTDRSRVVRIPTSEGYSVMVSPQRPDAFMEALRAAAASS